MMPTGDNPNRPEANRKRKKITAESVRQSWQGNIAHAKRAGFCDYVVEAIEDDSSDLKVCWCCGSLGYQEAAHIVPFSLGGRCTPQNMFLLCNECHVRSPDFLDPSEFIRFVNENAGQASSQLAKALDSAMANLKAMFEESPEKSASFLDQFNARVHSATSQAKKMAAPHGCNVSHSTKMACIKMASQEIFK